MGKLRDKMIEARCSSTRTSIALLPAAACRSMASDGSPPAPISSSPCGSWEPCSAVCYASSSRSLRGACFALDATCLRSKGDAGRGFHDFNVVFH